MMLSAADVGAIVLGLLTLPLQLGALVVLVALVSPAIAVFAVLFAYWAAVYVVFLVPTWVVIALAALPRQIGTTAYATYQTSVLSPCAKIFIFLCLPAVAALLIAAVLISAVVASLVSVLHSCAWLRSGFLHHHLLTSPFVVAIRHIVGFHAVATADIPSLILRLTAPHLCHTPVLPHNRRVTLPLLLAAAAAFLAANVLCTLTVTPLAVVYIPLRALLASFQFVRSLHRGDPVAKLLFFSTIATVWLLVASVLLPLGVVLGLLLIALVAATQPGLYCVYCVYCRGPLRGLASVVQVPALLCRKLHRAMWLPPGGVGGPPGSAVEAHLMDDVDSFFQRMYAPWMAELSRRWLQAFSSNSQDSGSTLPFEGAGGAALWEPGSHNGPGRLVRQGQQGGLPAHEVLAAEVHAWKAFFMSCREYGLLLAHQGWLPLRDIRKARPYLFIGLPGYVLLQALRRAIAARADAAQGPDPARGELPQEVAMMGHITNGGELVAQAGVGPVLGQAALDQCRLLRLEELQGAELQFLEAWVLMAGDGERLARLGVCAPDSMARPDRNSVVTRAAREVRRMALAVSRSAEFRGNFEEEVLRPLQEHAARMAMLLRQQQQEQQQEVEVTGGSGRTGWAASGRSFAPGREEDAGDRKGGGPGGGEDPANKQWWWVRAGALLDRLLPRRRRAGQEVEVGPEHDWGRLAGGDIERGEVAPCSPQPLHSSPLVEVEVQVGEVLPGSSLSASRAIAPTLSSHSSRGYRLPDSRSRSWHSSGSFRSHSHREVSRRTFDPHSAPTPCTAPPDPTCSSLHDVPLAEASLASAAASALRAPSLPAMHSESPHPPEAESTSLALSVQLISYLSGTQSLADDASFPPFPPAGDSSPPHTPTFIDSYARHLPKTIPIPLRPFLRSALSATRLTPSRLPQLPTSNTTPQSTLLSSSSGSWSPPPSPSQATSQPHSPAPPSGPTALFHPLLNLTGPLSFLPNSQVSSESGHTLRDALLPPGMAPLPRVRWIRTLPRPNPSGPASSNPPSTPNTLSSHAATPVSPSPLTPHLPSLQPISSAPDLLVTPPPAPPPHPLSTPRANPLTWLVGHRRTASAGWEPTQARLHQPLLPPDTPRSTSPPHSPSTRRPSRNHSRLSADLSHLHPHLFKHPSTPAGVDPHSTPPSSPFATEAQLPYQPPLLHPHHEPPQGGLSPQAALQGINPPAGPELPAAVISCSSSAAGDRPEEPGLGLGGLHYSDGGSGTPIAVTPSGALSKSFSAPTLHAGAPASPRRLTRSFSSHPICLEP